MTDPYCLVCGVCEWSASTTDGNSRLDVTRAGIAHYRETNHTPIRARSYTPTPRLSQSPLEQRVELQQTDDLARENK